MMRLKQLWNYWFDSLEAKDDNQKMYREHFHITDHSLIHCHIFGDKQGYIIYIKRDFNIDWVDQEYVMSWTEKEQKEFYTAIGKLEAAQTYPCDILDDQKKLNFKNILGVGYVNAFNKKYEGLDDIIENAHEYVNKRSPEKARTIFLTVASICILFIVIIFCLHKFKVIFMPWSLNISAAILFGTAGAYTSIWSRFKNLTMKGLSTRFALIIESVSRLFIGSISAIVIIMAFRTDIILTMIKNKEPLYTYSIIAFVAGFSERWLTSIVERFVSNENMGNERK